MKTGPNSSDEVVKLATPPTSVTADPRLEPSSMNCTVPVGEAPVTVAVKVTGWPNTLGLSDDVTTMEVGVCAKASSAPPTRPSMAVANIQTRLTEKIRFRTANKTPRNCRPLPAASSRAPNRSFHMLDPNPGCHARLR
jgi:hypothetical protein